MSARQRIDPIRPRLRWRVLSDADVERLDAAIIEVLGDVGVCFPLARALDALERGAGRGDARANRAGGAPRRPRPAL